MFLHGTQLFKMIEFFSLISWSSMLQISFTYYKRQLYSYKTWLVAFNSRLNMKYPSLDNCLSTHSGLFHNLSASNLSIMSAKGSLYFLNGENNDPVLINQLIRFIIMLKRTIKRQYGKYTFFHFLHLKIPVFLPTCVLV